MISKIKKGERLPKKVMQNRLMNRLGKSDYEYETYVSQEDYNHWQAQNALLDAMDSKCVELMEKQLEEYKVIYARNNRIMKQFSLIVQVNLMELKKEKQEECFAILKEAVQLTIPALEKKALSDLVLSIDELNLVLEYFTYQKPKHLKEVYLELLAYLNKDHFDKESRARLYPKIAYYFCRYIKEQREKCASREEVNQMAEEAWNICYQGMDALKNHKKLYFAWELLQEQLELLNYLLGEEASLSSRKKQKYKKEQKEVQEFFRVIDSLYEIYQIPKVTNAYTCFYREYNVYCINDVIRTRRKMLGMTRYDLYNICGIKTLYRIEYGKSNIQREIAQKLLERFRLPMSFWHAPLVTREQKEVWLEKQFRLAIVLKDYVEAEKILFQLKERVSMEVQINRQYILYFEEAYLPYQNNKISKEIYVQRAIEALENTIPLTIALKPMREDRLSNGVINKKEKYLTYMEITILYQIANVLENEETGELYRQALLQYFEWLIQEKKNVSMIGVCAASMTGIAQDLGSMGDYEKVLQINHNILKEQLRLRHMEYIEMNLLQIKDIV